MEKSLISIRVAATFFLILEASASELIHQYLKDLPQQKLSVDFVLQKGLENSSAFQQIVAQFPSIENPILQSEAGLDWMLNGQATYMESFAETANTAFPTFPHSTKYDVNVQKSFLTGTQVKAGWELSEQKMQIAGAPRIQYKESKIKAELSQNLLKNSFGTATRKNLEAASLQSKAVKTQITKQLEDYSLYIVSAYYQAWIDQQNTISAEKNLKRKQLLLKSTLAKFRRGTAERPDKIQIEGSVKAAEVTWLQQKQKLVETWQNLVVSLNFPREWLQVAPEKIPLEMPLHVSSAICKRSSAELPPSSATQEAEYSAKAATLLKESATRSALPDLSVFGSIASNAIEPNYGEAVSDSAKFNNIEWLMGVRLSMPLGFKAERAQARAALSQELASKALLTSSKEQSEIDFRNNCQLLSSLEQSKKILNNNLRDQAQRASLEQERFDLGRSTMFNVIQASDDAALAEAQLQQVEAGLQLTQWKLKQLSGEITQKVSKLMEKYQP